MRLVLTLLPFMGLLLLGCKSKVEKEAPIWHTKKVALENEVHNQLFEIEKQQGWELLFDGKTLNGWHLYNKPDSTHLSAWEVRDDILFCDATDESKIFGDLTTDKSYQNYELVFDWQMAIRGNGGVFINVQETPEFAATYLTGPEYQLLEPTHSDTKTPLKRPGCLWGIAPQLNQVEAKPYGQWNTTRIVQQDGTIEFYLNGVLTAKEDFNSPAWKAKVAQSDFAESSGFGKVTKGKIALQNWYFEAQFRNMKIREL